VALGLGALVLICANSLVAHAQQLHRVASIEDANEESLAFAILRSDLRQLPIGAEIELSGNELHFMTVQSFAPDLQLARHLVRVSYRFDGQTRTLLRIEQEVGDETNTRTSSLENEVLQCRMECFEVRQWRNDWVGDRGRLPQALRLTLDKPGGPVSGLFPIAAPAWRSHERG
jgi:hypothetical protein